MMLLTRSTKLIPVSVNIFVLSLAMSGVALGVSITLQNATATFSQVQFSVADTINGSFSNFADGWSIHPNIFDQTAVWETASDLNASSIQFELHMLNGFPNEHLLGRFRFSATSDDRSTFADGAASGGDVTASWIVLTKATVTGPSGMTFEILPDGSILAGGVSVGTGVYTVVYSNIPISNITGFRLEVIEDPSLPFNGPGRQPTNGHFTLTELLVSATPSITLQNATATFSQVQFSVADTIDGSFSNFADGWSIHPNITDQTAVWETASDLNASSIQFDLHMLNTFPPEHLLGRFRFSVTSDDRSTFADGAAIGGDVTASWIVLTNAAVTGPSGMTFEILPDGSILAGGVSVGTGVYTVVYNNIPISNITGFRLEVIEDDSLPFNGPGRQPTNGHFTLTELVVSATPLCVAPPAGLISWWPGDGNALDIVDLNEGMLSGATFDPGKVGQAFSFSAAGDQVEIPDSPNLNIESLPSATFEGWFKSLGGDSVIVSKHVCGSNNGWFFTTGQGGFIGDHFVGGFGVGALNLNDGHFHHFAIVKDGSSYLEYIDGNLTSSTVGPALGTALSPPVQIGRIDTGPCAPNQLNGQVDEVAIFDRALSSVEIQAIFNADSSGKCKASPAVADALAEAGFSNPAAVDPAVVELLNEAAEENLLSTVEETLSDNIPMTPSEAVVVAGTAEGNIIGDASNTAVLGDDSTVTGNIEGVGVVFTGDAQVDGNLVGEANELRIAEKAMVSFNGDVEADVLIIGEDGGAAINGNLIFLGSKLDMAPGAVLGVNGNISCSESMLANVHSSATIMLGGNNECPALEGKGGLE